MSSLSELNTANLVLRSLDADAWSRLGPYLKPVELPHALTIYEPDQVIEYTYFPNDAMVSVVNTRRIG
ncbi:MAG TPA: hypothetical protein VGO43_12175 [Pyrinomonadaceae bacterium]|jgi:hypothetical protein|nr:hypothetical protein [Pyrinomonadaceae bacterium]